MGGLIKCIKVEYNLEADGRIEDDESEDSETENVSRKMKENKKAPKRHKSDAFLKNNNVLHYDDNFLNIGCEYGRKKSNTVFFDPDSLNKMINLNTNKY